jgi:CRP/FNR family transcriptional regulator, cyclic AMP receptor protein
VFAISLQDGKSRGDEGDPGMRIEGVFRGARTFKTVEAGELIFSEGDAAEEMYGVVDGRVELRINDSVIAGLGPDESFGEMAIIDSSPRSATAIAAEDTTLAVIDRKQFLFLVHETPNFALQVMASLANRIRAHDRELSEGATS